MTNLDARMGDGIREYKPRFNIHRLVNDLFTTAAPVMSFAIATQQKEFPDVSFWQGDIDWATMRTQTDAVIIRAGQGSWVDSQFVRNWTEARHAGLKRGVYWFYDDRVDPGKQAGILFGLIAEDAPEMEIWCDWENSYGGDFGGLKNVVAFMQRVESLLPGVRVGMYTGYWFFREHSNAIANPTQYNYLAFRPLWLAWYSSNAASIKIPAPWSELLLWQYGTPAFGLRYGTRSIELDMNLFSGTQAEFDSRYGETAPPSDGGNMSQWYRATGNINIRQLPAAGAAQVITGERYVLANDVVEVEVVQSGFAKLLRLYRNNVRKDLAPVAWCGTAYLRTTTYTPPNEPPPVEPPAGLPDRLWIGETPETAAWYRKEA
jgi:lysozyme